MTAEKVAQHTPGPWTGYMSGLAGEECWHIGPQGQPFVALVFPGSDGDDDWHPSGAEVEANARLIAAAPDMLAFLKSIVPGSIYQHEIDGLIAKAEGRS